MGRRIGFFFIVLLIHQQVFVTAETGVQKSSWNKRESENILHRIKKSAARRAERGAAIGSAFGPFVAALGALICWLVCPDYPPPPPPPQITCYAMSPTKYTADEGKSIAVVSWREPTSEDGTVWIYNGQGPGNFTEGRHTIVYVATSDAGYSSLPCVITFDVEVITCTRPQFPSHGVFTCDGYPPIYGHFCQFTCFEGYQGTGNSSQKCVIVGEGEGALEGDPFSCSKVSCGEPETPLNAIQSCTDGDLYISQCTFPCKEGFDRDDQIASSICEADGNWNPSNISHCKDAIPPEMQECPDAFVAYVGKDQIHAVILYVPPTAIDTLDGTVEVMLVEGPAPGTSLVIDRDDPNANQHTVTYSAIDSGGLEALIPCKFTVVVRDLLCDPLENKPKLNTTCTEPLNVYGSSCHFSCFSGYPLEGNETVTCEKYEDRDEAYWNWGEGNGPTQCTVQDCPDLDPPLNGAIGCVPLSLGKQCVMFCNEDFDVPVSTDGTFVCDDAVGWIMEDNQVPDCTVARHPTIYFLPVEFTYTGDCSSAETQEQIKDQVIKITKESDYSTFCTTECTAENVDIRCGETSRKRAIPTIVVSFELSVEFKVKKDVNITAQYADLAFQTTTMYDMFLEKMDSGLLDLPELNLVADAASLTAGWADLECEMGLKMDYSTLRCMACPTGTKFNQSINDCTDCPIGTYQDQDAQFRCIPCQDGFSTAFTGSRHSYDCTEMCPVGSVSNFGITPCYQCAVGTYQDKMGQTSCIPCPDGTNTTVQGSKTLLNCKSNNIACVDSPCGSHGECVPTLDTEADYMCVCRAGYLGTNCSIPPSSCYKHACQHGATCVSQNTTYTCTCQPGYTGQYCHLKIVDGGWSPFERWSDCSVSCGNGSKTRYRICNLPYPQNGGLDCDGNDVEKIECNLDPCPACPSAPQLFGGSVEVVESEIDDTKTALLTCDPGKLLSDSTLSNFTCGESTGFIWMPIVERQNFPKCTELTVPKNATVDSEIIYTLQQTPENMNAFNSGTENMLGASPCVQTGLCGLNVSSNVFSSPVKRSTEIMVVVHATIKAGFQFGPYFVNGEFQAETVNSSLMEYVQTLSELESLMVNFENATKSGDLPVEINDQTYYPDKDSFSASGYLSCPSGMESLNVMCVNCPPGSKEMGGRCVLCDRGTYQDAEGQVNCIMCPEGQITKYTGSDHLDLCFTKPTSTTLDLDVDTIGSREKNLATNPEYIAIPLVLIFLIFLIFLLLYCTSKKRKVYSVKSK